MVSDLMTIVIWCIGVVAMAATSWLQDRRDRRQDEGEAARLRKEFDERLSDVEKKVGEQVSEIFKLEDDIQRLKESKNG